MNSTRSWHKPNLYAVRTPHHGAPPGFTLLNMHDDTDMWAPLAHRLLQEYRERETSQAAFTAEDLPPEVVSALEQHSTGDTRQFANFAAAVAAAPDQACRLIFGLIDGYHAPTKPLMRCLSRNHNDSGFTASRNSHQWAN